jgi:2,4-dienoyl-CoA reductase-like NADH-dependent reductase (Old Yellow Enzyme family)
MSIDLLFTPLTLGAIQIPNRIIMAPLTRMRAGANNVPTTMNASYYAQRASAGLIISEERRSAVMHMVIRAHQESTLPIRSPAGVPSRMPFTLAEVAL